MAEKQLNRRQFAKTGALVASAVACPAIVRRQNLNSRLQVTGIGCDGKGWTDIKEMSGHAKTQMVGFCDIDLARMFSSLRRCPAKGR